MMTDRSVHLHLDDAPGALAILAAFLGRRRDRDELGYTPDAYGAEVDWDRLIAGNLSTTPSSGTVAASRLGCGARYELLSKL